MPSITLRIRTALNIHAGEGRMAVLVIGVMLLTSAGFTLGSTGVEALFFARFGVEYLPYMYMGLGVLSFLTSLGITALLGRVRREKLYTLIPIGVALLTLIAWMALFSKLNSVYPVLWLGKEVVNSLISLVVWGIAGTVCDTRQSKRLFPLFNAGRILGAVLGGLGTGLLVNWIGTQNLLLVWAGTLLLAFMLTRSLMKERIPAESAGRSRRKPGSSTLIQEMQQGYQFVRGSALTRWVSIAAVLFSILYFSIALPFSQSATAQFTDENALAGFLGFFNGLSTAAAFLASIFLANRLYARFGIMNATLVLPIIYLIGFAGLAITNSFAVVITFRFMQMFWLSGIADSAYQAMFNAVPPARRDQVRAFIGGVPEQAGTFLAGLILIIGAQAFSSRQLAIVGLASAIATTFIIWRASHAYNLALVDSLRKGRPTLFADNSRPDAAALNAALDGMKHPDPMVRRVSTEIVSGLAVPSTTDALVGALQDVDLDVRISALKGLARLQASSALLDVAALLSTPQPELRAQAVDTLRALTPYPHGLNALLAGMLNDQEPQVQVRAIVALLSVDASHSSRSLLRMMSMLGDVDQRVLALNALAEVGDPNALILFTTELNDEHAPIPVRCAAASALASCGPQAIPELKKVLAVEQFSLKTNAASALGRIGEAALPAVLGSLMELDSEEGALLALEQLPAWKEAGHLREYIQSRVKSAIHFDGMQFAIRDHKEERIQLLAHSLHSRARRDGIHALKALSLLSDRETLSIAVDNLRSQHQVSNALESLESIREAALIRPLFRIWEPLQAARPALSGGEVIASLANEKDDWLRACAIFSKDGTMETLTTLSIMERILLLRRVPLLAALPPADLQRVAVIAAEQEYDDGDAICRQGETGDEMFVIISGEVRIVVNNEGQPEREIARRAAGDVVGEMSLISGDLRIATVLAVGDVRTLCLDRLSFESLLRERPEVGLAVMRELCTRLKERN
jgi:HEAT repeat protein